MPLNDQHPARKFRRLSRSTAKFIYPPIPQTK